MKKVFISILGIFILSLTAGCQNTKTHAVEGSVIGGLIGATAGGIIGHQGGHGLEGAGIGAAVGALGGGLVGGQMEKKQLAYEGSSATLSMLTMGDIIELNRMGISDADIIDRIRATSSTFSLSANDIKLLQESGVSDKVIEAMQGKI